jgi:hypothetical protein
MAAKRSCVLFQQNRRQDCSFMYRKCAVIQYLTEIAYVLLAFKLYWKAENGVNLKDVMRYTRKGT